MPTQIAKKTSACWFWCVCCQHKSNTNPTHPNTNCKKNQRLLGLARVLPTQSQHKSNTSQQGMPNSLARAGSGACVANTNPTQIQHSPTQVAEFPSTCWIWRVRCQHKSNTTQHKLPNSPAPAGFDACVANTNTTQVQHSATQVAKFPSACWAWRVCCQHKSNTAQHKSGSQGR